ncbi:MAG: hypothetical protein AABZ12_09965 [Planctomycetota bacterium]
MNHRRRTVTVLLSLAAGMTGTASLLTWLEPTSRSAKPAFAKSPIASTESLARLTVGEPPASKPESRHEVLLAATPSFGVGESQ